MLDVLNQHTVWVREEDPYLHIGPPKGLVIPTESPIFQTRCGLEVSDGIWGRPNPRDELKELCPQCRAQAGI